MRYLTLITFLIIYTLVSPARAEYQSGYNPKEEYNCRYSLGSERMFFHENGVTAPLEMSKEETDNLDEIAERLADESEMVRMQRNQLLIDCDWTQLPDSPLSSADKTAWATYRQQLRDLTSQTGFPWNVIWPSIPS